MGASENLLAQAQAAADDHHDKEARELLRQLLEAEPHNSAAWVLFSIVGQNLEAKIDCARRALQYDPGSYPAWNNAVILVGVEKARTMLPAGAPIPADPAVPTPAPAPAAVSGAGVPVPVTGVKLCPFCAEEIQAAAIVCKHCKRVLSPVVTQAQTQVGQAQQLGLLAGVMSQMGCWLLVLGVLVLSFPIWLPILGAIFFPQR